LAATTIGADLDGAGDLGQHRRVLGFAGLEDFGHARQAARDVHRAGRFLGLAGELLAGLHLLAVGDFDTCLGRQVVEVENLAVSAFDGDARVALALVFNDNELGGLAAAALALLLHADGLAFLDVLVADDAALLGQDRR